MALDPQGFAELQNDLAFMAMSLENGSGVDRALQAGAAPIEQQMLANASSDPKIITGALHGSIRTDRVRQRRGGKQISIGVKHSEAGAYVWLYKRRMPERRRMRQNRRCSGWCALIRTACTLATTRTPTMKCSLTRRL